MWVSLQQHLMQLAPHGGQEVVSGRWAIKESHCTVSVCLSYLANTMLVLGGTEEILC